MQPCFLYFFPSEVTALHFLSIYDFHMSLCGDGVLHLTQPDSPRDPSGSSFRLIPSHMAGYGKHNTMSFCNTASHKTFGTFGSHIINTQKQRDKFTVINSAPAPCIYNTTENKRMASKPDG